MHDALNVVLHAGDGQLSLSLAAIRDKPDAARTLGRSLAALKGVHQVKVTPATGHVLIRYDPWKISKAYMLRLLGFPLQKARSGSGRILINVALVAALYLAARRLFPGAVQQQLYGASKA